jgi:hypothetical protein
MSASEAIQPTHLSRLALVYLRQSSPHQVLANQESLNLQYDLQHRACAAGWDAGQVRIIDCDLGRSGRSAEGRRGFQEVVSLVNQEQVGILFAYDVTRLAAIPGLEASYSKFQIIQELGLLFLLHWRFFGSKGRIWGTLAILHSVVESQASPLLRLE